jgi:type I restriction enzyme S subunit
MSSLIKTNLHSAANLVRSTVVPFTGSTKYIATADVDNFKINPSEEVTYSNRPTRADIQLEIGDVLQARMKETNKPVLVNQDMAGWIASTGFARFKPKSTGNSPDYIFHFLSSPIFLRQRDRLSVGSTQQAISDKDLKEVSISIPSDIDSQNAISNILNLANTAIENTETLIEKYQQIKAGLMHDLFTRGIGTDGKLRQPREGAPELYQETPIGWIPKDWSYLTLRDLSTKITDGDHQTPIRATSGIYLLSARNVLDGKIALQDVDYVPEFEYQRMIKRCNPEFGDILVSCSGSVGRVSMVPEGLKCCLVRSAALIKPNREIVNSKYLERILQSPIMQFQIKSSQKQAAQPNLFQGQIEKLLVPVANVKEQYQISDFFRPLDNKLDSLLIELEKLSNIKLGLMHDLLTGKIQVKNSLEATHV